MFSCLSTYIGTNQLNILPLSALRERERCKDLQNSEMEILCKYPPLWSQTRKLTGLTQIYLISYQVNGSQRVCSASSAWDQGIVLSRSPIWMSNWPRGEWEQFFFSKNDKKMFYIHVFGHVDVACVLNIWKRKDKKSNWNKSLLDLFWVSSGDFSSWCLGALLVTWILSMEREY